MASGLRSVQASWVVSIHLPLPLQPPLRDLAHEQFPRNRGVALQCVEPLLYLVYRDSQPSRDVLNCPGVALFLGHALGRIDLGLEFSKGVYRHFASFDGLGHLAEEPGFKRFHGFEYFNLRSCCGTCETDA